MSVSPPSSRAEALLHLRWLRGACGPYLWLDAGPGPHAGATAGGGSPTDEPRGAGGASVPGPRAEDARPQVPVAARPPAPPPSSPAFLPPSSVPDAPSSPEAPAVATDPPPVAAPTGAPGPDAVVADPLDTLRGVAEGCRRCGLCETRTTVVFGEGARRPRLVVVGEAPGADEDASGRPFVGKAGQLLTRMLLAIGLRREDVYICNVLKCRPPANRAPAPDEVAACRPYLLEQLRLLAPELILVLGNPAARAVLRTDQGISSIRGRLQTSPEGFLTLPSFHPSYLLRTPAAKKEAWLDLQLAAKTLRLVLPGAREVADAGAGGERDPSAREQEAE